jgi:hypothetical protein
MLAARAWLAGLTAVLRAPALIFAATVAMFAATLPFALVLGTELQAEFANQQPVSRGMTEIDPEWWLEFREHAEGLAATFTPTILGFAAPLDNLSSLLDGTRRPWILFVPLAVSMLVWAFLWGAALYRFAHGGVPGMWRSAARTFVPFTMISLAAAAVVFVLYVTVHPLLFGPIAARLQDAASTEQGAFMGRVLLYVIFGTLMIAVSLVADYARVSMVVAPVSSAGAAFKHSWRFVTRHPGSVFILYLATGLLFVAVLIAYGTLEIEGGSRVGGWRGIAIAQAYIVARLIIRLTFGASEVWLYRALEPDAAPQPS